MTLKTLEKKILKKYPNALIGYKSDHLMHQAHGAYIDVFFITDVVHNVTFFIDSEESEICNICLQYFDL